MSDRSDIVPPPKGGTSGRQPERRNWAALAVGFAIVLAVMLVFILWVVPKEEGEWLWTEQMVSGGWMAWSFPVAFFFWIVACLLAVFTVLAIRYPETPRVGILGMETTRGDRLFMTLLGSAFINIAWLGWELGPQVWALAVCAVFAALVFWKV